MKDVCPAAAYAGLLPDLMKAAREVGYALAPHGSFARDFDLIAVPWVDDAVGAEALILRLIAAVGGRLRDGHRCLGKDAEGKDQWERVHGDIATPKPHGRRAWTIFLGDGGLYLDVSVMPRRKPRAAP